MPFTNTSQLPDAIKARLTEAEQMQWMHVYNEMFYETGDEAMAIKAANGAVSKRWTTEIPIVKADEDEQLVYGWLSVAVDKSGEQVVDLEGDMIDPLELEKAAHEYMLRQGINKVAGEMHTNIGVGRIVESMVFTKQKMDIMGIPPGIIPEAWWVCYKIDDADVWQKIKDGTYKAFSIGGRAIRETINEK